MIEPIRCEGGDILGRETRYMNIFSIFLHFLAFIISIVVD